MGLLRLGMIVAVGVALLPADSEQQEMLYNRAALAARLDELGEAGLVSRA